MATSEETVATGADVRPLRPSPTERPPRRNGPHACSTGRTPDTRGTFVFRTRIPDAARDSQESFDQIIEFLQWLGLDWDEGSARGPHGPPPERAHGHLPRRG